MALVAACLTAGMVAAPSAAAAEGGSKAKAASAQKAKSAGTSRTTTRQLRRRIVKAEDSLRGTRKAIQTLLALSRSNKDGLAFLSAAAPQLINGLVQLRDGTLQLKTVLETQVGPGLEQLKTAVTTTIPDAIKDNVTKLAGSNEYGQVQVLFGATPVPGANLTSPNIPDELNGATLTGQLTIPVAENTAATPLTILGAIRSGESDGTGASLPVGHAGLVSLRVDEKSPNVNVGGGGAGGSPLTSATNVAAGGLPVYAINSKSPFVDPTPNPLGFPSGSGQTIDLTSNLFAGGSKFTLENPDTMDDADGFAVIDFTIRFVDLSPSSSDLTA